MRMLIMGGTAFAGRHIAQAALDAGHEVTLFHRGKTGAGLFPAATHLSADRNGSLAELATGTWDATIDVCAYVPRQVRSLARALDGRGGQYLFISSTSVYRTPVSPGFAEDAPLAGLDDPDTEEITGETYGGLKVACERLGAELFGPATAVVRPTYIIGPYDRSYRFTWWVERIARGGEVLAPGAPADPIQVIDARDLAAFTVGLAEHGTAGAFHAVSPPPPFGIGDMLAAIAARVAPPGTRLTWVDTDFLVAEKVPEEALPLWPGGDPEADINAADPAAARAAGLRSRPLADSIDDIHAHQAVAPDSCPEKTGLDADREGGLLAAWAARST
ncbi:MAG TPA: NAD-dependent epimerase/dehydratase family protein [Streptosporangiaceae bacterium]